MTPGGLTLLSTARGPSRLRRLRVGTRSREAAKKDPVTRGRRAGIRRLQPPHFASRVRDWMRPPLPAHALLRGAKRPVFGPERGADYVRWRGTGISFFGDSGKGLYGNEELLPRKSLYPRSVMSPLVIAGLDPAIHTEVQRALPFIMDARVKPAHDEVFFVRGITR